MTRKRHMSTQDKIQMWTAQLKNTGMFVDVDEDKKHVSFRINAQFLARATDEQLRPLYEKCIKIGAAYRQLGYTVEE